MPSLVATLPLRLVCQLFIAGSPGVIENGITAPALNLSLSPAPTQTEVPVTLPVGYIAYPDIGAAYKIYNEQVLWKVARRRCISDNGNLAVIDSAKKFDYLSSQRLSKGVTHVGIHSLFDDNEWVSVKTGLPVTTIPWVPGEPNGKSRCAMVMHERGGLGNFECTTALGDFVCEISIPDNYRIEKEPLGQIIPN